MARVFIFEPLADREDLLLGQLKGSISGYRLFKEWKDLYAALENSSQPLVLIDVDLLEQNNPGELNDFLERFPGLRVIGFSSQPAKQLGILSLQYGILVLPLNGHLALDLKSAVEQCLPQIDAPPTKNEDLVQFIGRSEAIRQILKKIEFIAASDIHILITGETGSGKTVLAKLIHQKSKRRSFPFYHINCAAIPEQLLEAELFGFKKGAFTGAMRDTPGKFKAAGRGTILLDEIGEMPVHLQAKILRVLDEGLYFPIGAVKTEKVNARIIAATNKNIEEEIKRKNFRKDLYFRLNTIEIHIPPLKERKEDIPLLFDFYLDNYLKKSKIKKPVIRPNVYEVLMQYHWPGNIRELQNLVETLMYLKPKEITIDMLPPKLFTERSALLIKAGEEQWTLEELKREYARYVYHLTRQNKSKSAKLLGVDVKTFRKLIKRV